MKKLIFIFIGFFLIGILFSVTESISSPYFWWDVKGITDKDATVPPGPGDGIPDTKIELLPCQKVWIDLLISEVPLDQGGLGLMNVYVDIFYDPTLFTWEPGVHPSIRIDDNWPQLQNIQWRQPGYLHLEGGAPFGKGYYGDNIEVALLDFHCNGKKGSTILGLEYQLMFNSEYVDISSSITQIPIEINQVPIPGTLILIGSGFLGLIGLRRKFRF